MRTPPAIALVIAGVTLTFPACAGKSNTASIGGDLYLLMQNGDVKRGAANTVRLLADSSLRPAMDGLCRSYAGRLAALGRRPKPARSPSWPLLMAAWVDSQRTLEANVRAQMSTVLLGAKAAESATGVNGHYQVTGLAPGRYVLWAETEIGDRHYTWWAPLALAAGDSVNKDLDNSAEADHLVYCGHYADSVSAAESLADAAESVAAALRAKPLQDCYRDANRATTGYLEDRIAECNRKFGNPGIKRN